MSGKTKRERSYLDLSSIQNRSRKRQVNISQSLLDIWFFLLALQIFVWGGKEIKRLKLEIWGCNPTTHSFFNSGLKKEAYVLLHSLRGLNFTYRLNLQSFSLVTRWLKLKIKSLDLTIYTDCLQIVFTSTNIRDTYRNTRLMKINYLIIKY